MATITSGGKILSTWKDKQGNVYTSYVGEDGDNYIQWVDTKGISHIIGNSRVSSGVYNSSAMSMSTGTTNSLLDNKWTSPINYEFDGYAQFIVNSRFGITIPIIVLPESISDSISATYNKESVVGRSAPVIGYSDTQARSISFTVKVFQDMLPSGLYFNSVESYLNQFRALCYPEYMSGAVRAPECVVHLGELVFQGVCESCNIEYSGPVRSGERIFADVSLSFVQCMTIPMGASEVINTSTTVSAHTAVL